MTYRGVPVEPDHTFRVAMQEYHYGIMADTFGVSHEEIEKKARARRQHLGSRQCH